MARASSPHAAAAWCQRCPPPKVLANPSLEPGPPPAWHLARLLEWYIIHPAGQAPSRFRPLSSNVRPHTPPPVSLTPLHSLHLLCAFLLVLAGLGCSQAAPPQDAQLEITEDGQYVLNAQHMGEMELKRQLHVLRSEGTPVRLQIYAHATAKHEAVSRAMKAAQDAGVDALAFVTSPPPAAASSPVSRYQASSPP
jgi:hypothetical protein